MKIKFDAEKAQELLDSGYSKRKVSVELGIHHSYISRAVGQGVLFDEYFPFDEVDDDRQMAINFEWLWEEDMLEFLWKEAFENGIVTVSEHLTNRNFYAVGKYVKNKYGDFRNYLASVDMAVLEDAFYFECKCCRQLKNFSGFCKYRNSAFGIKTSECTKCIARRVKEYRSSNPEYAEKCREACRAYARSEAGRLANKVSALNRRALKLALPNTLTPLQIKEMMDVFQGCALTGEIDDLHIDHVIPVSSGHGGTTKANIVAILEFLNLSKHDGNIFEWFELNKYRLDLSQKKFDKLIDYLANLNDMTIEEYRDYVYWCHANPRTVDDLRKGGR